MRCTTDGKASCYTLTLTRVTVGNKPSGTFATMIPIPKTRELIAPFPVAMLIMKKVTPKKMAIDDIILMNLCSSRRMGVWMEGDT